MDRFWVYNQHPVTGVENWTCKSRPLSNIKCQFCFAFTDGLNILPAYFCPLILLLMGSLNKVLENISAESTPVTVGYFCNIG